MLSVTLVAAHSLGAPRIQTPNPCSGPCQHTSPTRRMLIAAWASTAAATWKVAPASAKFSPTDKGTFKLAMESIRCREEGCTQAPLDKLTQLLDVTGVPVNSKGNWFEHDLEVVKCAAFVGRRRRNRTHEAELRACVVYAHFADPCGCASL